MRIGDRGFHVPGNCTLRAQDEGQVTLNVTNNDYGMYLDGDNVTIDGFVFSGGGLILNRFSTTAPQENITITHNVFEKIYSGKSGIGSNSVWLNVNIRHNSFSSIGNVPWNNVNNGVYCEGGYNVSGLGITQTNGMDQSAIEYNEFDHIVCDGIHVIWNASSTLGEYVGAGNNSISYNVFHDFHRMAIEAQGQTSGNRNNSITGLKVAGNFAYGQYAPYYDSMIYSLVVDDSQGSEYLDNTGIEGTGSYQGCFGSYGMELSGDNVIVMGTVLAASSNCSAGSGWPFYFEIGSLSSGTNSTQENSLLCGASPRGFFGYEGSNNEATPGRGYGSSMQEHNYTASACPNAGSPGTSDIEIAFASSTGQSLSSNGTGTWNVYATNNISIRYVQFFVDGGSSPFATQEMQDLNTNFELDRKWLYHATLNTRPLAAGTHVITAAAIDVSGAVQCASQSFTVGSGGSFKAGTPSSCPAVLP